MRLIINQIGYYLKVYDSKDLNTIIYSAEIFTNRKEELLQVYNSEDKLIATIRQTNYKWLQGNWKMEYEISILEKKESYHVNNIKFAKRHWIAKLNGKQIFEYFGHNGHKKYIYKNDKQVALIDKEYFHLFNRDTIYIDLNNDENPLFILTYTLLFELNVDNDSSTFNFDFGDFGGQVKKYDETWRPK